MWLNINGELHHVTDETRITFKTTISKALLDKVEQMAHEYNTHNNYLIENGLMNILNRGEIFYSKKSRPKDRKTFGTTYNDQLLDIVETFAMKNGLRINDVIEYSIDFINPEQVSNKSRRFRIIKEGE